MYAKYFLKAECSVRTLPYLSNFTGNCITLIYDTLLNAYNYFIERESTNTHFLVLVVNK